MATRKRVAMNRGRLGQRGTFKNGITGGAIAELPIVLLVLFIFLAFPMLNLATAALRTYFIRQAILEAAHDGAKACTFEDDVDPVPPDEPGCLAAKTRAGNDLTAFQSRFPGVSITNPQYFIIVQNVASGTESSPVSSPLADGTVNEEENRYYFEVRATGSAQPLVPVPFFDSVPGLGGPMVVQFSGRELFEQVEGLVD